MCPHPEVSERAWVRRVPELDPVVVVALGGGDRLVRAAGHPGRDPNRPEHLDTGSEKAMERQWKAQGKAVESSRQGSGKLKERRCSDRGQQDRSAGAGPAVLDNLLRAHVRR